MNNHSTVRSYGATRGLCKLGIDTHAQSIMVARQIEGMTPQPPQKFAPGKFLPWVKKQIEAGYKVVSCYEAGPTGFWLHRELVAAGVTNYVVCPTRLDSRGKGVNTDKTDALELVVRLDRYVAGNRKAFSVVQVPTLEQERKRVLTRQREQFRRKRLSFAAQGRMLMLSQGVRQKNNWWKKSIWERLEPNLPAWLVEHLKPLMRVIELLNQEVHELEQKVKQQAPKSLPVGLGQLTHEIVEREIKDWNKFNNRRQVGSYSGLTGGVSSSGQAHADLSITKAGNGRLSCCLVECAWRIVLKQPKYWLVKKWGHILLNPKVHARKRKQAIVAFARR